MQSMQQVTTWRTLPEIHTCTPFEYLVCLHETITEVPLARDANVEIFEYRDAHRSVVESCALITAAAKIHGTLANGYLNSFLTMGSAYDHMYLQTT